jgi:HEPN domain-containing protein
MASKQDLAEQLLRRADTDAAGARAMLPIDEVADVLVCFHAQQAVEKALKAVLAARGVEFPFIHDISGLAKLCREAGAPLPGEMDGADLLTARGPRLRRASNSPRLYCGQPANTGSARSQKADRATNNGLGVPSPRISV